MPNNRSFGQILLVGVFLMLLAWIADASIDTAFSLDQDFLHHLLSPDPHELSNRLFVLGVQTAFLIFIGFLLRRRQTLEEALVAASQEAEAARTRAEAILDALGDGISIQDRELRVTYQNRAHRQAIGQHLGEFCYRAYQQRDEPCPECHLVQSFADGQVHRRESSAPTEKGRSHVEIISTPLRDRSDRIVAGIEAVRDITARKEIEARLQRQLAAMESSMDGMAIYDLRDGYIYLNQAHADIYGYDAPADLLGSSWHLFYQPEEIRRFEQEVMPVLKREGRWRGEAFGKRQDGSTFPQEVSLAAISGGGLICVVRDISERHRAEAAIRRMNRDLERRAAELTAANRDLEAFSYSLSHDLRSYLSRIYSAAEILQAIEGVRPGDDSLFCLRTILEASEGMDKLIEAMLTLAQMARRDLSRKTVDLSVMAAEIVAERAAADPDREVTVIIAPGMTAEGDRQLLKVVLENLFANAWKYTRNAAPAEIVFESRERDGVREFCLRDNGIGFDMKETGEMFKPFHRLANAREFPGTGIGLTTVQRIIQRHGGDIRAQGKPGEGAAFFFTLP